MSAQSVGKYAGEFMAIGVGGRALGLGGAHAALASDATAGYWNPSGLARLNYPEAILMHDERFGNLINYDFATIAMPYGADASVGISILRLGVDGIPDTRNAWLDANGNRLFDDNNRPDYDKVTYFNSADWAIYLSYAKQASADFYYGANVKLIRRDLAEHSATGIGFDIGLLYSPITDLYLGLNAQDITTTFVSWSTGRNELISPTLKVGSAYFIELFDGRFAPAFDVDIRFENRRFATTANLGPISLDPHVGLEFDYKKLVALRAGYSDIKQITFGAGVRLKSLDVDYSYAQFGATNDLGNTHRISIRFVLQSEQYARVAVEQ
ncbi:MAG: PorV/PorQ family protein [Bacteroidota bacterium]